MLGNFPLFLPLPAPSSPASRTPPTPFSPGLPPSPVPLHVRCHAMKCQRKKQKTNNAISIHESFLPSKGGLKKVICRTLCLHLKKLTPIKCDCINKPCPVMRHAILFLQHIFWYCSAVLRYFCQFVCG